MEVLQQGRAVVYGACEGFWVMILFAPPTKPDMLLARPSLAAMKRRHPSGFPTLTWVLPEAGYRMETDAREAASTVTKEFDAQIRAQATLIEGSGFQAAAVRAIIGGLDAMSRTTSVKKVFSELTPASAWCLEKRPEPTPASLSEVVRVLGAARDACRARVR